MSNPIPVEVRAWRRETRPRLIAERLRIPEQLHRSASLKIESFLEALFDTFPIGTFSMYWPFQGEVDLRLLAERLRGRGWVAALPAVVRPRAPLEFLQWDAGVELEAGVYDIPIPKIRKVVIPDVVVAPVIGFDGANYRLGFGGGFFDITLGSMRPAPKGIGVGFEVGRLDTIHPAVTDIPMDFIVTEAGIQRP